MDILNGHSKTDYGEKNELWQIIEYTQILGAVQFLYEWFDIQDRGLIKSI